MQIIEQSYAGGARMTTHAHTRPSMSILTRGMLRERRGRREETALPLSVSFMAADICHADEFGPHETSLFQVHFDEDAAEAVGRDGSRVLQGWTWLHGGPAVRLFVRLVAMTRAGSDSELRSQQIADVISAATGDSRAPGRPPAWLERVRESIDDTHGWPVVSELATAAGVHRVHLARQFRRYFGASVSDYIRHRRVQHAAHRINVAGRTMSEVAHMSGFYDQAHMCRAFRELSALSPTEFRALARPARKRGQLG